MITGHVGHNYIDAREGDDTIDAAGGDDYIRAFCGRRPDRSTLRSLLAEPTA